MSARKLFSLLFGSLRPRSGERGLVTSDLALISLLAGATLLTGTLISGGELGAAELEDAVRSGIGMVSGTLYVRGSVVATTEASPARVRTINLPIGSTDGLRPLDLTSGSSTRPTISLTTADMYVADVPYDVVWTAGDGDIVFEPSESAVFVLRLDQLPSGSGEISSNERWTAQVIAMSGGAIEISRTMPTALDPVVNLH